MYIQQSVVSSLVFTESAGFKSNALCYKRRLLDCRAEEKDAVAQEYSQKNVEVKRSVKNGHPCISHR